MRALSARPFCPCDDRWVSLRYLSAGLRYTTQRTGLDRFVAVSYGAQHQVNRQVEEAIVAYRHEESARLAKDMPAQPSR